MSQRTRPTLHPFLPFRTATTIQAILRPDERGWALIQAGQRAANASSPSSDGFITTTDLARKLGQLANLGPGELPPDNQQVNKYVYRLRRILDGGLHEVKKAKPWKGKPPHQGKPR